MEPCAGYAGAKKYLISTALAPYSLFDRKMHGILGSQMIPLTNEVPTEVQDPDPAQSRNERHRARLHVWRITNREGLRQYGRQWKTNHPERVLLHRQNEYAKRRTRRRRLRLRREAQRRRRALKRFEIKNRIIQLQ